MSRAHTLCQANCGRPAGSGFICTYCLSDFKAALEDIPDLIRELEIVNTRQAVYSTRYGSRPTETPLPFHTKASEHLARIRRDLERWSVQLIEHDCPRSPSAEHVAQWLLTHTDRIRNYHRAGQLVNETVSAVERGWWLVDRPPDRWYAGPCSCGRHLYATTKTGPFNCPHCKQIHDADNRRTWMLREAEDHLANAGTAARAVSWLGGTDVTPHRIYTWVNRGRLVAKGHEPYATPTDPHRTRPLYRIGDILDLVVETINTKQEAK